MEEKMSLLKVQAEGQVTSFRLPHFMWNKHLTFEMPPPSTIYGHICSTLGDLVDPAGLVFAYRFSYETKFEDYEHIWSWDEKKKKDTVKPFRRELLFRPKLTLYINRPEWIGKFKSPQFLVVLGRSQDLMTYTAISIVEAIQEDRAYFESTLLPMEYVTRFRRGMPARMPRFLNYEKDREPSFENYIILKEKVVYPPIDPIDVDAPFVYEGDQTTFWVDPTIRDSRGTAFGLMFHSWVN